MLGGRPLYAAASFTRGTARADVNARRTRRQVREWVEHHAGLGVGKIYITDSGSAVPLGREIRDYIASGLVDYFYR